MNNDLISRSELKKAFEEDMKCGGVKINEFDKGYDLGIKTAIEMLDNAKAVVPEEFMNSYEEGYERARKDFERPHGKWVVVNQDNEGIHEIKCPFCHYSKGSDFSSILTVTFERLPPFCEKCGSELGGDINDASIGTT